MGFKDLLMVIPSLTVELIPIRSVSAPSLRGLELDNSTARSSRSEKGPVRVAKSIIDGKDKPDWSRAGYRSGEVGLPTGQDEGLTLLSGWQSRWGTRHLEEQVRVGDAGVDCDHVADLSSQISKKSRCEVTKCGLPYWSTCPSHPTLRNRRP